MRPILLPSSAFIFSPGPYTMIPLSYSPLQRLVRSENYLLELGKSLEKFERVYAS